MEPDFGPLREALEGAGADGYLLDAASSDSNQRYLSGFDAPDPFVTLYTAGGIHLLVSSLEYGRARSASRAESVSRLADYDYHDHRETVGEREARTRTLAAFLDDRDVRSVAVPERFPLATADGLRDRSVDVAVEDSDALERIRSRKTGAEIEYVRETQRHNEAAMRAATDLLGRATPDGDALAVDGEVLTSERVREEIEVALLRRGCGTEETIVACGADAADPHERGSGPLAHDEPIIVDVFPRDRESKYHADMTRTFVVGSPSERVREWFDLTDEARRAAIEAVEPDVTGAAVHDAAATVYEEAGYSTLRSDPGTETGFIHGTGHGVGLDVHERPRVNPDGGELEPRNVITIEPGLYDPSVGGVRIEDLLVVTEDGHENLTEYPIELVVE